MRRAAPDRSCAACTCGCMPAATSMRPSTMCVGGKQIHHLPLELFIGDAIIADLRDKLPGKAITEQTWRRRWATASRKATACCCAPITTTRYDGGSETWMTESPYLTIGATEWCIDKGVVIVGYDFYHGNDEPGAPRVFHNSRTLSEHGIITMPYLEEPRPHRQGPVHADRAAAEASSAPKPRRRRSRAVAVDLRFDPQRRLQRNGPAPERSASWRGNR